MNAPESSRHDKNTGKTAPPFSLAGMVAVLLIVLFGLFVFWHQCGFQESSTQPEVVGNGRADEMSVSEKVRPQQQIDPKTEKTTPATDNTTTSSSIVNAKIAKTTSRSSTTTPTSRQTTRNTAAEKTVSHHREHPQAQATGAEQLLDTSPLPSSKTTPPVDQEPIAAVEAALAEETCDQSAAVIHRFYQHLDDQKYLEKYDIHPDSEQYFSALIQKLIDNPPVVSGETDDLFTILKNTAHFFRVIGKQNIAMLKEILHNEHDQLESILARYYTIIHSPRCSAEHFDLTLFEPALYNYAGFFLSTMGGRLYLFRRDSRSRMVISYYAILLIDRANALSSNKHGIEISTSINLLIDAMESTANTLLFKERYLDTLYTLKEQYQ